MLRIKHNIELWGPGEGLTYTELWADRLFFCTYRYPGNPENLKNKSFGCSAWNRILSPGSCVRTGLCWGWSEQQKALGLVVLGLACLLIDLGSVGSALD